MFRICIYKILLVYLFITFNSGAKKELAMTEIESHISRIPRISYDSHRGNSGTTTR